jgi:LysM repeat protein
MAANNLKKPPLSESRLELRIPTSARIPASSELPAVQTAKMEESVSTYVVKRGDSLWKIASSYGTTVRMIQSVNGLKGSRLRVGQVLKVPRGSGTTVPQHANVYRVKRETAPI